jgi:hypothetical protein
MMGARVSLYQMLHRERLEGSAAARAAVGHYMAMVRNWLVPTGAKPARGRAAVPPPARVQA